MSKQLLTVVAVVAAVILILTTSIFAVWQRNRPGGADQQQPPVRLEIGASDMSSTPASSRLAVRLSAGAAQPAAAEPLRVVAGDALDPAAVQAVLARLPALPPDATTAEPFQLPDPILPPPLTGETVASVFPPEEERVRPAEPVADGPLAVLRFSPEGDVPLAPSFSVTFNQPMVPLATLAELAAAEVPVRITPSLPGVYKWLGTRTLRFEYRPDADSDLPIDRLPMATEYTVEVPAGTPSAVGTTLAQAVRWTFRTPPPTVQAFHPQGEGQPVEPIFFAAFDQLIDPAAVLATVRVEAGRQVVPLRLATAEELAADAAARSLSENQLPGRWLAFRATQTLPTDTAVTATIGPGVPSAEGPRRSAEAAVYTLRTYAPLRVVEHRCGWGDTCRPLQPFNIRFNNLLDTAAFTADLVRIEPPLPGATISVEYNTIVVSGATKGRTNYVVTVSGAVRDQFGQTLGRDATLTFSVGSAEPTLSGPNRSLITLDPSVGRPLFSVYTINYPELELQVYAVQPGDWFAWREIQRRYYDDRRPTPPGALRINRTIATNAVEDELTETMIDLSEALDGPFGQLIVIVRPPQRFFRPNQTRPEVAAWVQVTRIGLDAYNDAETLLLWTSDLADGAPLAETAVDLGVGGQTIATGADGMARLSLSATSINLLVARRGNDLAILPRSEYPWDDSSWRRQQPTDWVRWFVFDDRQMYRPGEELHLKGWLRRVGAGPAGDLGLLWSDNAQVRWEVYEPQGNRIGAGSSPLSALGGFDLRFAIPTTANLGQAWIDLTLSGGGLSGSTQHSFQIQEFRRPEFEVTARNETSGPYFAEGFAVTAVDARYYAGGPLPNAEVTWTVTSRPSSYSPPNWPGFTFGEWLPWWQRSWSGGLDGGFGRGGWPSVEVETAETFSGFTDAGGTHYLRLDFDRAEQTRPTSVLAEATVMDVNRQAWSSTTALLVHPAERYVGLRSERYFVQQGAPIPVEVIVTDVDGRPDVGREAVVEAARMEWRYANGRWTEEAADVQTCRVTAGAEPVSCTFETPVGGSYRITATVRDDRGRVNQSRFVRWVSGGKQPAARTLERETVTLIPNQEQYQPGDVAEILVQAPFAPAEGLLLLGRSGLLGVERFTMSAESTVLRIPITEAHIPNLHVQVDLVGSAVRTADDGSPLPDAPSRPAYAGGSLELSVPPRSRTLDVTAQPRAARLEPGGSTTVDVTVRDAAGRPIADAEVAVVVVDEAVLALTGYQLADPIALFYASRDAGLASFYGRAYVILANPEAALEGARNAAEKAVEQAVVVTRAMAMEADTMAEIPPMATMAAALLVVAPSGVDEGAPSSPIAVRSDFNPLAVFAPAVRTATDGTAAVEVKLPDNLTRYRIMVVAVAGEKQFGSAESTLTARLPLMVRPSAPRFLNFGDRFELPVVVQNQTDEPLTVELVVAVSNLALDGDGRNAGRRVLVPANDRVEVRFPTTTLAAGSAAVQFAAVSGRYADAATVELPVYTPATTEAFATYGVLDAGAVVQPVLAPADVFPQFGALSVNTSSTALQALTDAVIYLVEYPYECSEQFASRILAISALRDVLAAFEAEGLPDAAALNAAVQRDVTVLQQMQNSDGGFPIWQRGWESQPYYSVHAAHALQRARAAGYDVSPNAISAALAYLSNIEQHYDEWYSQEARWSISAYALYLRQLLGAGDAAKAARLLNEAGVDRLPIEATAWIWRVLHADRGYPDAEAAIRRHLNNRAVETPGAANFTSGYSEGDYLLLGSDRRADAVVLAALMDADPGNDLIPKVVNGLLAHRTRGRWGNTQENVFVLLALETYFKTFEAQTPDFTARFWLGDAYLGAHTYRGRTTERNTTAVPLSALIEWGAGAQQPLLLTKEGPGRLYYRLGLTYAPTDLALPALDMGFVVQRSYEGVDDPQDVYQDADGVWRIKAGARVRVRLTLAADNRRYHVALVDPLPAGLEIINPALAVSQAAPADPGAQPAPYFWWYRWTWYDHQNMRDERAEAFTSLLWQGVYDYTYLARATTPGRFVAPPAKAEEMYTPEVFGRSTSAVVVVEER